MGDVVLFAGLAQFDRRLARPLALCVMRNVFRASSSRGAYVCGGSRQQTEVADRSASIADH